MPLIRDGRVVLDAWSKAERADELSADGDLIVPLALWQAERGRLLAREGRLGLALEPDQSLEPLAADLGRFALIALRFPKFTDGRAYSLARLLRERHRFAGELRAIGNVLSDQLRFMQRCGFDTFEVADERALGRWSAATGRFSEWYQPAAGSSRTIPGLRLQRRPAPAAAVRAAAPPAGAGDACAGHWAY